MIDHLTIFKKGLVVLSVPLLVQLFFAWRVTRTQRDVQQAQAHSARTREVLATTQDLMHSLADTEANMRGYLVSGHSSFVEPYFKASREVAGHLEGLRALAAEDPAREARARGIVTRAEDFLAWQAENERLARAGRRAEALERLKAGDGQRSLDDLRQEAARFRHQEERRDRELTDSLDDSLKQQQGLVLAGALAAFVITASLAFVLHRGVSHRMAHLTEEVRRLNEGRPSAAPLLAPAPRGDEITRLDHAFRHMAEHLSQVEDRFRAAFQEAPFPMMLHAEDGEVLQINKAWAEGTGYAREDLPTLASWAEKALPAGPVPQGEAVITTASGGQRTWDFSSTRLAGPLPDGRAVVLTMSSDITARKQAEGEVRRLNAELEERVWQRTVELETANRDLAAKNQENEMFVYSVSHDLRSPLVNLEGFNRELGLACHDLRALLAGLGVPDAVRGPALALLDGEVAEARHYIETAVARLGDIIDALLRLSRAGRVEHRPQEVDVAALVGRIVESLHASIAGRGAEVTVGDLPAARGDPTALEQVFSNLLDNALKYLDPARPGRVEVGCTDGPDGRRAYFVKDNGRGIPEAYQHKVFQVFQRVHTDVSGGDGMGLAIVRRIVERHGGKVWVESRADEGSTFYVSLPDNRGAWSVERGA